MEAFSILKVMIKELKIQYILYTILFEALFELTKIHFEIISSIIL